MSPEPRRIILVGCVSRKAQEPLAARDLYQSPLFAKRRAFADAAGCDWYILSALHGVIRPDQVVHPYNLKLTRPRIAEWSFLVRRGLRLEAAIADGDVLEVHAGSDYVDGVERACAWLRQFETTPIEVTVEAPLRGLGIGHQLAWYRPDSQSTEKASSCERSRITS